MRLRLINRFDRFNYRMLLKEIKFAKIARSFQGNRSEREREKKSKKGMTSKLKYYLVFRSIHFILLERDFDLQRYERKIKRIVYH